MAAGDGVESAEIKRANTHTESKLNEPMFCPAAGARPRGRRTSNWAT